ncbi:MAG TPA: alpha/beta fold hydrolase [Mycobacteriales bacterium]|nr:alpha/beta fold hydrolase [Mycobacteriales bacterium]
MPAPRPRLNRVMTTTRRGITTVLHPSGLRGTVTEIAWVAAHGAMYPWGAARRERARAHRDELDRFTLSDLPPVQRGLIMGDVVAAGTPIILLHGLVDNGSIFVTLRRSLRRRGFGRVITLNYSPLSQDVRQVAQRLSALVEKTCQETGYEKVHVVGHSLGGVVARYYVQRLGGHSRVHTLCTLGSPHAGTQAARLLPSPLVKQLRPGSDLMAELAEPAPQVTTRFVAFWSDLDELIVPKRSARLEHPDLSARNVLLRGVGHMSLPINSRVVREIATLLAHLDEHGTTVTAGVTSIDATPAPAPEEPAAARRPGSRRTGTR